MENKQKIYLISGPLGVGKTSVTKKIAELVDKCVVVEGDIFLHMLDTEDWIT